MIEKTGSPLAQVETQLRYLLPANLYAISWVDPTAGNLKRVFDHLRTLRYILHDYIPRQVAEDPPQPGVLSHEWQEGALMFTDLTGFTPLVEAYAKRGKAGATALLDLLNDYFGSMIEIISKSDGNLLEFTGDAMLIQFPVNRRQNEVSQAVRAGLRMQRAMERFDKIETDEETFSLGQRIGIHTGRFLTADIGTPRYMAHVLLGGNVLTAKHAEGAGSRERVNLTESAYERVKDRFRFEPGETGHMLVIDDFTDEELGEYEITPGRSRMASAVLFDRSVEGLVAEIERLVDRIEPLASFFPSPMLKLLVESAAAREIPPDFPKPTIIFINLIGLPEAIDDVLPEEEEGIVACFSDLFAQINAVVEARGGVVMRVTYHLSGSDMLIVFGVPASHIDDPQRAADAALAIRDIVYEANEDAPTADGKLIEITCQIGMALGETFVAEIGETRNRRQFNIQGDAANTAARLMGKADGNRILMTEAVKNEIEGLFECESLGSMPLKGKSRRMPIHTLLGSQKDS
jgi:class 3 adenylate cyclase